MLKHFLTLTLCVLSCLEGHPIDNSTNSTTHIYDVIVIGGGVSGLTTLSQLNTAYDINNTLLIEASNRLGGRVNTIPFGNGSHIELGAQWVHGGSKENPLYNLMNRLGQVEDYEFYGDSDTILAANQNGEQQDEKYFSNLWDELSTIFNDLQESDSLEKLNETVSFGYLLDLKFVELIIAKNLTSNPKILRAIYDTFLSDQRGNFACENFYNLSAQWLAYNDDYDGEEDVNLKDGFIALIEYLNSTLNEEQVNLNEKVVNVDWSQADEEDGIIVVSTVDSMGVRNKYATRQLVTSVSLNVLKNSPYLFTPELPQSKRDSINNLTMGTNNKLFFVFDEPVFEIGENLTGISFLWDYESYSFSLNADKTCNLTGNQFYKSFAVFRVPAQYPNILFSEFVGKPSEFSEEVTDQCLILVFKELLEKFYPKRVFPNLSSVVRSKWSTDELIQGGYTYVPVGGSYKDIENLAESLNDENKIYFVGEATSSYTGTVHGAYQSGLECAKEINDTINSDNSFIKRILKFIWKILSSIFEAIKNLFSF